MKSHNFDVLINFAAMQTLLMHSKNNISSVFG
jgi:hypothetical protein